MEINITKCTSTANTTSCNRIPKFIVLHYTAGTSSKPGTAQSLAKYFAKPTTKASADFIVDDASIVQYNPDPTKYYCWSVGGKKYSSMSTSVGGKYYNIAKNSNCINIEMCSNKSNKASLKASDTDWYITDATLNNSVILTRHLMGLYNIPASNVIMHHHVTGKICPNPFCVNEAALAKWDSFKSKMLSGSSTPTAPATITRELYRVRKTWADVKSQIGAYTSIENAKKACKNGYSVFNSKGNIIYSNALSPFLVIPLTDLNIRRTPNGVIVKPNGAKKGIKYTIVEVSGNWGRLKSGAGWISILDKYVQRV